MAEYSDDEKQEIRDRIDVMNAMALADNLTDLRLEYEARFIAIENDVATLRGLIENQTQVIGNALQAVMGRGSTVKE